MGFLGNKLTDEERAEELFSPYLDNQVTAEERKFLEQYLANHPEAHAKLNMLTAAVQMTKTLPTVKAPRSFVLPRSMARKPALALRLYPMMRLATVAATALFIFAAAQLVVAGVRDDPEYPRFERLTTKGLHMFVRGDEGFLRRVGRRGFVAHDAIGQVVDLVLVGHDQRVERVEVALAGGIDQGRLVHGKLILT